MTARILYGKLISEDIKNEVITEIKELETTRGFRPNLSTVRIGDDPASAVYVRNKVLFARDVGITSEQHHLPEETSQDELLKLIRDLNDNEDVDGILVQLPLPEHIDEREVIEAIDPAKDVDGFHPVNVGKLSLGYPSLLPCTPAGVIEILKRSDIGIAGKHAVVVGRSNIVGKPMSMLLLRENATVTVCHSRTADLASITRQADILVAAIGKTAFIGGEHIREGATVIDVGINKVTDESLVRQFFPGEDYDRRIESMERRGFVLVGDVHPYDAWQKAGSWTPVPGGVGLLTVAMLMKNTVSAAKNRRSRQ